MGIPRIESRWLKPDRISTGSEECRPLPISRPYSYHLLAPVNCRLPAGMGPTPRSNSISRPYVHAVKVATALRQLKSDGWVLVTQRGSHRQFKHPSKSGRVTVAGKPSDDLAPGTLKAS